MSSHARDTRVKIKNKQLFTVLTKHTN